jgi:hypothetical protein
LTDARPEEQQGEREPPTAASASSRVGSARASAATRSRKCSGIAGLQPEEVLDLERAITTAMPAVKPVVTG